MMCLKLQMQRYSHELYFYITRSLDPSFQLGLARGYSPARLGVPKSIIPQDLINAFEDQSKIKALHRLIIAIIAIDPQSFSTDCLPADQELHFYFETSHQNFSAKWKSGTVVKAKPHFITV